MSTKRFLLIASVMVFGTVILGTIAVVAILLYGNMVSTDNSASQTTVEQTEVTSTSADEFVFLQSSDDTVVTRVSLADGSSTSYELGINSNAIYTSGVAFTDDGRLAGFCVFERAVDSSGAEFVQAIFTVRDLDAGVNLIEEVYPNLPTCAVTAFSPDGALVAVSFVFNSVIEGSINYPSMPNWALRLIDVTTGNVVNELTAESDNAPDYITIDARFGFEGGISPLIRILAYTETDIYYQAVPFVGRGGLPIVPAHRWNMATGAVTDITGLERVGSAVLAETGEIAYPYLDESRDYAQPMGPIGVANTVRIDDNGTVFDFYHNNDDTISAVHFVNGGAQLLIALVPGFDPANPNASGGTRYVLLNRDGSTASVSSMVVAYNSVDGTSDGFVTLTTNEPQIRNPRLTLALFTGNERLDLWTQQTEQTVRFLNTSRMRVGNNLPTFAPIN